MHPISKVNGAGPVIAARLTDMGITTAEKLLKAPVAKIAALPRVGEIRARKMIDEARKLVSASNSSSTPKTRKAAEKTNPKAADKKTKGKKPKGKKADKKKLKAKKSDKNKKAGKKNKDSKKTGKSKSKKKKK